MEKIKVFISSRCGGERINFDKLVDTESTDKKAIAEKATKTNYDLVRRGLRVALENTGVIKTYIFEDDTASTSSSREDYIFNLDQSDVCLFLIDNFDKDIPECVLAEFDRAKQTNKKSIFIFLNHPNHEVTIFQKNFTSAEGIHYYVINDIREFIDKGFDAIKDDIIQIYQKYCRGYFDYDEKETSAVEITIGSFPIDTKEIDKQIFKNLGLTKNKIVNLVYRANEKEIQTSEFDKVCLDILEVLLGEKKFDSVNLTSLLKTLSKIQSSKLHEIVSRRWEVIAILYKDDLDGALAIIESAYNTHSKDTSIPKWLINDILIDWRNLKNTDAQIKNGPFEISIQEKINQQDSLIYFPLVDRFSVNINDDILDRNFKLLLGSPYSTTFYNLRTSIWLYFKLFICGNLLRIIYTYSFHLETNSKDLN